MPADADEERVVADRDAVLVVEVGRVALPHDARDEAEGGAGVLADDAVVDDAELEVAEAEPVGHGRQHTANGQTGQTVRTGRTVEGAPTWYTAARNHDS